jgi:hypothetical protein
MFQSAQFDDPARDPYDGVPLGVEAIVSFIHEPTETERSRDEDRPAAGQIPADPGWRG